MQRSVGLEDVRVGPRVRRESWARQVRLTVAPLRSRIHPEGCDLPRFKDDRATFHEIPSCCSCDRCPRAGPDSGLAASFRRRLCPRSRLTPRRFELTGPGPLSRPRTPPPPSWNGERGGPQPMSDENYVYLTGAVIGATVLVGMIRKSFDPFAPHWLFLTGFAQVYVV